MTASSSVEQLLLDRDEALKELKLQLSRAQTNENERGSRGHRRDIPFAVGDLVYLKLRHYCQKSMAKRHSEKLSLWYYGPFEVESRVGQVAYKLKLPVTAAIHPVFHIFQLRKAIGDLQPVSALPSQLAATGEFITEPETVLGVRPNPTNRTAGPDVLIKWKNLPEFEATWEPFETIRGQFPSFHLEDKVDFGPAGYDRPQIWFTYARREKRNGTSNIEGYHDK
ncbi:uncharacterized protein LOC111378985 [Olea europaea var. sylvestris]|uniref:uncharacterized protein LOC111378985 n=1 Tax=Olea europaea var. sylvestris TaxID=158386 RepID=UPI000C1D6B69|nr:uncharacterized protein LOC111378985 [Olea europaea var. sylvestris]